MRCENCKCKKIDYLEEIFKMQKRLQDEIGIEIFKRNFYRQQPNQDFVTLSYVGVITEACEALENTPWKPWKKSARYDRIEFRKELVDLLHFVVNLFLASGMTPKEIYEAYKEKHEINMKRQKEKY